MTTRSGPIVTFIGSKPGTAFALTRDATPSQKQALASPGFLTEVFTGLLARGARVVGLPSPELGHVATHDHLVVQVSALTEVNQWLAAYFADGKDRSNLRVQFVGHSESGSLSLGGTWIATDKERFAHPFYMLDSSPRPLRGLSLYLGNIREVMLAGCYIGSRVSNGNPVNGRTLLFTLAEMWHCKVRGANTSVQANDFDRHGWYYGNSQNRPVGWAWDHDHDPIRTHDHGVTWDPDSSRKLAPPTSIASGNVAMSSDQVARFTSYFDAELRDDMKPRLRVGELELALTYPGRTDIAQLTCNGQFLEILSGPNKGAVYANAERRQSDETSRLVAGLLPSFGAMT